MCLISTVTMSSLPMRTKALRANAAAALSVDGCDLAGADLGHRQRAGAQRLAVEEDRARTALGDAAAELGAGQSEIVAQDPKQGRVRKHIHRVDLPIHVDLEARHRK